MNIIVHCLLRPPFAEILFVVVVNLWFDADTKNNNSNNNNNNNNNNNQKTPYVH